MDYVDYVTSLKASVINRSIARGNDLGRRFGIMCASFRGFHDPSFDLEENKALLNDFLAYEDEAMKLDALLVFYSQIARMFLQTGDLENCIMYALAGKDANTLAGDEEGVLAAERVIADCCLVHDAADVSLEILKQIDVEIFKTLSARHSMPNQNEAKVRKLLARKRRPKSFAYLFPVDKRKDEENARFLAESMHMSIQTARNHVKSSK
jgi:hypothetical protein